MNIRVMITGAGGFVGGHVVSGLVSAVERVNIFPTSRQGGGITSVGRIASLDVTDKSSVSEAVERIAPTHIIHLAGIAALPAAAANADVAWKVHVGGTLNIAAAIMKSAPECLLIHAGSGQVYGGSAKSGRPLDETTLLAPTDTYTASKAAADLALGALAANGLRCLRFRPFNHIGPGQSADFAIASFARQIAHIKAKKRQPVISVGNLEAQRDFLDVRDVAFAYISAIIREDALPSGTILNLASGRAHRIRELLDMLLALAGTPIAIDVDKERLRPNDIPVFVGDAGLAHSLLRWQPTYPLERTLRDILEAAERDVKLV